MDGEMHCLNHYCGRLEVNGSLGPCGACPRGYQPQQSSSICVECTGELKLYDWLYLMFMSTMFIVMQFYYIDTSIRCNQMGVLSCLLYLGTLGEAILSSLISLFVFTSDWSVNVKTCGARNLSDWYTLFYNPSGTDEYKCTHEAVYPLYSIVLLFYLVLLAMVLLRPLYLKLALVCVYLLSSVKLVKRMWRVENYSSSHVSTTTYYILYSIPGLIFIHSVMAGIIYNIYPYLAIVGSVISIAVHLSHHLDQNWLYLVRSMLQCRNLGIVLLHWAALAFGIISLTELHSWSDYLLLALVPVPTLFYILTSKFTDPSVL